VSGVSGEASVLVLASPRRDGYYASMLSLEGKHALVFGVASESSIAWAIAKRLHAAGARISLGYQQTFKSRVLQLVKSKEVPVSFYERCDVTSVEERADFFAKVASPIDVLVHSIAYASPETFAKRVSEVTQEEFSTALTASAFSLIPVVRDALPKLGRDASVLAMSYLGGQRVVANYKVMGIAKAALEATVRELAADIGPQGIRVNAISAGPIRTLAASQIKGFDEMMKVYRSVTPLRRSVEQEDVGNLAAFLSSDLARNITGQTLFVDAGYNILAMAEYTQS
jgi:enoyl-[acyl-carrier protein] reductase I